MILVSAYHVFGIIHPADVSAVQTYLSTTKIEDSTLSDIAYDPVNERMYVTNSAGDKVSIVDTNTNTLVGSPKVGTNPKGIAYDPVNERMYVTNFGSGTVSIIDTKSKQAGISIPVGSGPHGIAYDPINMRMYVTLLDNNSISMVDTRLNEVVTEPIKLDFSPQGIAYNDANEKMYVTSFGNNGTVSLIDTKSNTVLGKSVKVGSAPQKIAYDPLNNRMYITNSGSDTVAVIEGDVPRNIGSFYIDSPSGIVYDPKNQRMYVSSSVNNVVNMIETNTNTVIEKPIYVAGSSRDMAYDAVNDRLYIPNGDLSTVSIVQLLSLNTTLSSSKDGLGFEIANGTTSTSDMITFGFHASDINNKVNRYECRLDGSRFVECNSPQSYNGVESGYRHAFEVRTVDENGNIGESTKFLWQVDLLLPRDDHEDRGNRDYGLNMGNGINDLEASDCSSMDVITPESNKLGEKYGHCNYDQDDQTIVEKRVNPEGSHQQINPRTNASMTNLVLPLPL